MAPDTRKLVTIICEAALEKSLGRELADLGAHGYTITDARGRGSRGLRDASWREASNIRIEIVCDAATATRISEFVRERYYDHYAMILFAQDVSVLRPKKF
jgi:nitrogen regulatory protein PII